MILLVATVGLVALNGCFSLKNEVSGGESIELNKSVRWFLGSSSLDLPIAPYEIPVFGTCLAFVIPKEPVDSLLGGAEWESSPGLKIENRQLEISKSDLKWKAKRNGRTYSTEAEGFRLGIRLTVRADVNAAPGTKHVYLFLPEANSRGQICPTAQVSTAIKFGDAYVEESSLSDYQFKTGAPVADGRESVGLFVIDIEVVE